MLERTLEAHLGLAADWLWIDLYFALPALFPERFERPTRLADCMSSFGIETFQRHHALGDGWAIAQLFLAVQAAHWRSPRSAHADSPISNAAIASTGGRSETGCRSA
ncbi:hypothetical protein [Thauera humireducens]|uniref:hypothetical protein n=1 Tax=Thauera humireducens TaxID=1134435 RepID=UPI0031200C8F